MGFIDTKLNFIIIIFLFSFLDPQIALLCLSHLNLFHNTTMVFFKFYLHLRYKSSAFNYLNVLHFSSFITVLYFFPVAILCYSDNVQVK